MWQVDVRTLSAAERALWDAFPRGAIVDLTGRSRVAARTIRAEVIAALLLGALPAEGGRIAAVRLTGARITGALDLAHGVIAVPVRLQRCELDRVIDLTGAKARDIDLSGSNLPGLTAPLAEVDGNLDLSGCECSGPMVLSGAHVTGALDLQDARLTHPGAMAFLGNRLTIDGDLIALRASVDGEFRLAGSRVGGSVLLSGANLGNEGGYALHAPDMSAGAPLPGPRRVHRPGRGPARGPAGRGRPQLPGRAPQQPRRQCPARLRHPDGRERHAGRRLPRRGGGAAVTLEDRRGDLPPSRAA